MCVKQLTFERQTSNSGQYVCSKLYIVDKQDKQVFDKERRRKIDVLPKQNLVIKLTAMVYFDVYVCVHIRWNCINVTLIINK